MSTLLSEDEIRKATLNAQKIQEFLQAHAAWRVAAGSAEVLDAAHRSIAAVTGCVEAILVTSGIRVGLPPEPPPAETTLPPGEIDGSKLARIASFLAQLAGWVKAYSEAQVPISAAASLKKFFSVAVALARALERILDANALPYQPVRLEHEPATAPRTGPLPPPAADDQAPTAPSTQLELVHSFKDPLLREVQKRLELNAKAEGLIDGFLAESGIAYSPGERRRFLRKVVDWIQSTPEGHHLVLRVSALRGKLEPYASYAQSEG